MKGWIWVAPDVVRAIHDEQIAEHGGSPGLRDEGLFMSTLARPMNLCAYADPDAADLAAAYGFGLARNHPFVDGNKRTAFVVAELFLELNGYELRADDVACVTTTLGVADGSMAESELADWLRRHRRKRESRR